MSILEAILLGLIQGLTEFLPVSSSGHLEISKALFNLNLSGEESMLVTVVLHLATALSTIAIFRKEILEIIKGLFQFKWNEESQFAVKIIVSMIPATVIGLVFEEEIEQMFEKNVILVAAMLLLTGGLLFLADRAKNTHKEVSFLNALIIGVSQAIAILPGISRSGATISTSVLLGIDRTKAARFSFLMVVPLILGKVAKDLLDFVKEPKLTDTTAILNATSEMGMAPASADLTVPLIIGFLVALVSGFFACKWMIALVQRSNLKYFAFYCFAVGIIAIVLKLTL